MKFRIDKDNMIDALKVTSAEIYKKLGVEPVTSTTTMPFHTYLKNRFSISVKEMAISHVNDFSNFCDAWDASYFDAEELISLGLFKDEELKLHEGSFHACHDKYWVAFSNAYTVNSYDGKVIDVTLQSKLTVSYFSRDGIDVVILDELKSKHLKGKPSRVITKMYGEEYATKAFQESPLNAEYELMLTDMYIPEWYLRLREDESVTSCMAHHSDHYGLPDDLHPTMCYEGLGDVFLGLVFDKAKGRPVGRCIVKVQGDSFGIERVYGSPVANLIKKNPRVDMMEGVLELQLIKYNDEIVCPYVDGIDYYDYDDTTLYAGCGDLQVNEDLGFLRQGEWCEYREEWVRGEDMTYVFNYGYVCESALNEAFFYCNRGYEWYEDRFGVEVGGELVHEDFAIYCDYSDSYYLNDDHVLYSVEAPSKYLDVVDENLNDCIDKLKAEGAAWIWVDGEEVYNVEDEDEEAA